MIIMIIRMIAILLLALWYICTYPPPRLRAGVQECFQSCLPVLVPVPIPIPVLVPVPVPGAWSVLKNLDLGGRTIHPPGWPRHGLTPPKTFQNQSKIVSFLNPFSNAFLDRFLVHFASQLASQNPLTCVKNRCRDAFHLGLHFWIDFWLIFAPNLDPLNPIWH